MLINMDANVSQHMLTVQKRTLHLIFLNNGVFTTLPQIGETEHKQNTKLNELIF